MNNRNMIGILLAFVSAALVCVLATSLGEGALRLVGKAAWFFPYAAAVSAVRLLKAA